MQDLKSLIEGEYEIKIHNMRPYRAGYILDTTLGRKYLKECFYSAKRIEFIHSAKKYLTESSFSNIDKYILTRNDKPYIRAEDSMYTIVNMIEGRECEFDNDMDVRKATSSLAKLHKAGKGFNPPGELLVYNRLGKTPYYFDKRVNEIRKLRKKAEREKNLFDYMFLENYQYFYELGMKSLENLYVSKYNKLVENVKKEGVICHHDYSYQNIIMKGNRTYIVNFDFCSIQLKIYDLVNLIRRKMRKSNWDIAKAKMILDTYREVENLTNDEIFVMKSMLQFPQKFWRVVNRYYNSKRSWAQKNFLSRLQEVIEEKKYHDEFIQEFDKII